MLGRLALCTFGLFPTSKRRLPGMRYSPFTTDSPTSVLISRNAYAYSVSSQLFPMVAGQIMLVPGQSVPSTPPKPAHPTHLAGHHKMQRGEIT